MRTFIVLSILLGLSGCANMSEQERNTAMIIGGILIVGAIAAQDSDSPPKQQCGFAINGDRSQHVCWTP